MPLLLNWDQRDGNTAVDRGSANVSRALLNELSAITPRGVPAALELRGAHAASRGNGQVGSRLGF